MIQDTLAYFCNGKQWSCGETYESLNWLDDSPKPTESQVNEWVAQMPTILANKKRIAELKQLLSESDYRMTSDYYGSMSILDKEFWTSERQKWRIEVRVLENN